MKERQKERINQWIKLRSVKKKTKKEGLAKWMKELHNEM